jgi:PAS domain S-box-containing protein/putative nucleotidyltransferase with HDIG domain
MSVNVWKTVAGRQPAWARLLRSTLLGLVYYGVACGSLVFIFHPSGLAAFWPANGLVLAALLLSRPGYWPAILAACFAGDALANLSFGRPVLASLAFGLANNLGPALGGWLFRRLVPGPVAFRRLSEVLALLAVAGGVNAVSALTGAAVAALAFGAPYWQAWLTWWVADGLGVVLITPLFVCWLKSGNPFRGVSRSRLVEGALMSALVVSLAWLIFVWQDPANPILYSYLILPFLVWAALRLNLRGLTALLALLAAIIMWGIHHGVGLFSQPGHSPGENLLVGQQYLSLVGCTVILLQVVFAERRQAEAALRSERDLAGRLMESSPAGIVMFDRRGLITFANPAAERVLGLQKAELTRRNYNAAEWRASDYAGQPIPAEQLPFRRVMDSGEPVMGAQVAIEQPDGRRVYLVIHASPLFDSAGQPDGVVAIIEDLSDRRRVEQELQVQRDFAHQLLKSMSQGLTVVDSAGRFEYLNPAYLSMVGYSLPELVGKRPHDVTAPQALASLEVAYQQRLAGQTSAYESTLLHRDGHEVPVLITGAPRWSDGQVSGAIAVITDLSEQKRIESQMRASEQRYRQLVESSPDGIAIHQGGKFVYVNPAGLRLLGAQRPEQVIGQEALPFVHPDSRELSQERKRRLLETGLPQPPVEEKLIRLDGQVIDIEISSTLVVYQDQPAFQITLRDIAERTRAAQALRESAARFRSVTETAPDAVLTTDSAGVIEFCNAAAEVMFGWRRAELVGQSLTVLMPEQMHSEHQAGLERLNRGEQPRLLGQVVELLGKRKDGRLFPMEMSQAGWQAGGRRYYSAFIRDITERKQHQGELQAIASVSAALRRTKDLAEMLPALLDQVMLLLEADGAALARRAPGDEAWLIELARGAWSERSGQRLAAEAEQLGRLLSGETQEQTLCIPLVAQEQLGGLLLAGRALPFSQADTHLLEAISEIAANAFRRAEAHEQTQKALHRLTALHEIDAAISASLDLRLTLAVLVNQIVATVGVDAAAVLLYNPWMKQLVYAAGSGFRTSGIHGSSLRLGEGAAGQAALTRRPVQFNRLAEHLAEFGRGQLLTGEGFNSYIGLPLIAKGQIKGVLEVYHRRRFEPDPDWLHFLDTLSQQAAIAIDNVESFEGMQRSNIELAQAYDATIQGWSNALDLRDEETEGHTLRVSELTVALAQVFGISGDLLVDMRRGALLHDIGKMGVPDRILLKPGPLDEAEWQVMRKHPEYAFDMLSPISFLNRALEIPAFHHEKWDGSGYPRGLKGIEIPLAARLFAVVDVWDAMTSDRPYRQALSQAEALAYIRAQAGKHFDPQVVERFLQLIGG